MAEGGDVCTHRSNPEKLAIDRRESGRGMGKTAVSGAFPFKADRFGRRASGNQALARYGRRLRVYLIGRSGSTGSNLCYRGWKNRWHDRDAREILHPMRIMRRSDRPCFRPSELEEHRADLRSRALLFHLRPQRAGRPERAPGDQDRGVLEDELTPGHSDQKHAGEKDRRAQWILPNVISE
jgi:hypothetical protein